MTTNENGEPAGRAKAQTSNGKLGDRAVEQARRELLGAVGYRQPPRQTQFKKGQSGNPKGRPRGTPQDLSLSDQPTLQAVLRASKRSVRMREGDKVTEVTAMDAVIQAIVAAALKGNARSQGLAVDLIRTAEQAHARDIAARNAIWSQIKERGYEVLADAARQGKPAPELLPHPDDIEIDPRTGPRVLGPVDAAEKAMYDNTIAFCELLLKQDALDCRPTHRLNGKALVEPGSALLLFSVLQSWLPPRLRKPDIDTSIELGRYHRWPIRKLLLELHGGWKKIRWRFPRGTVMLDLADMQSNLGFWTEFLREGLAGRIDIAALDRGEIDLDVRTIAQRHGVNVARS